MMEPAPGNKAYLFLHISVILWGFTAILGKLISLREFMLVWYRMCITAFILALLPGVIRAVLRADRRQLLLFSGIGALVALHWICFYGSIKYANASVALSTLATCSVITSIIEPIITGRKFKKYELLLGIAVMPGIYLVTRSLPEHYTTGTLLGLLSALLAAIFTSLNKRYTTNSDPKLVTLVELGSGFLFLTALLPVYLWVFGFSFQLPGKTDLAWLVLLSLICTALPYILWLKALRSISAFTANLTNNLEPVYGIIMAAVFFQENKELDTDFYLGTALILATIFLQPAISKITGGRIS